MKLQYSGNHGVLRHWTRDRKVSSSMLTCSCSFSGARIVHKMSPDACSVLLRNINCSFPRIVRLILLYLSFIACSKTITQRC